MRTHTSTTLRWKQFNRLVCQCVCVRLSARAKAAAGGIEYVTVLCVIIIVVVVDVVVIVAVTAVTATVVVCVYCIVSCVALHKKSSIFENRLSGWAGSLSALRELLETWNALSTADQFTILPCSHNDIII